MPQPSLSDYLSQRYAAGGHAVTRLLSQRIGAVLAWGGMHLGLSPSAITLLGTLVFLLGALCFAVLPAVTGLVCSLLLFQTGYGLDCADGQLARATQRTSAFGAWLDVACDYARNVMLGGALVHFLLAQEVPLPLAYAAGGLFAAGAAVQLHTVTVMRQADREARLQTQGWMSRLRALVTAGLDTATVLLVLPLLRPWPVLLAAYAAAVGLLYLAMAVMQAHRRLPGPAKSAQA